MNQLGTGFHSMALNSTFAGKTVWMTGHTGFKGSWLAHWLLEMGARVIGYSLPTHTKPSLFDQLSLNLRLEHQVGDLRRGEAVEHSIQSAQPDFVFHLGAQAIVRTAFERPVETYETNVMGTAHVLESLRKLNKPCACILVTTDKVYENREWVHAYRETDPVGGWDPYSSSKAAAEIAIASWRRSFFDHHCVRLASARAGNVIGGGDWAKDRIVPDCIRALQHHATIPVRNKISTRPWQHVLEPLSGYLWLASVLSQPKLRPYDETLFPSSFNFGPNLESNRTVRELVEEVLKSWPGAWHDASDPRAVHEASLLNVSIDKAFHLLGWKPVWGFEQAVAATVSWYRQAESMADAQIVELTTRQIHQYCTDAAKASLCWAKST